MTATAIKTRLRPHVDKHLRAFARHHGITTYAAAARLIEQALQPQATPDASPASALLELAALHESLRPVLQRSLEIAAHAYVYARHAARAAHPDDTKKLDDQMAVEAAKVISRSPSALSKE